ncbi:hypothetical protein HAX54_029394 [Datura stramonium]|uniref:Uncharacterized protein n=1 Tax=Datura stramonium TaxID=4076 RepID=A0ABS8Y5E8_DATST|nr:hypothetical protein [Datura stramonium]
MEAGEGKEGDGRGWPLVGCRKRGKKREEEATASPEKNRNEAALHGCGRRGEKKRRGEKRRLVAVRKGVKVVLWFSGDDWGCSPEFIEIMVRRRSSVVRRN